MHLPGCRAVVLSLLLVATAQAGEPQDADAEARGNRESLDQLVIGDGYSIEAARGGLTATLGGDLVKANDNWLVLRRVRESRHEFGVPMLSKVPVIGSRVFTNTAIGRQTDYLWIPRDQAKVVEHFPTVLSPPAKELLEEAPPVGSGCAATCVVDGIFTFPSGSIAEMTEDRLTLVTELAVAVTTSLPYVGELPLVGGAFRRTTFETRRESTDVDCHTMLYLTVTPRPTQ